MRGVRLGRVAWVLAVLAAAAGPSAVGQERDEALAGELDAYLRKHVLAPRYPAAVDREHGGFHAHFARDWSPLPDRRRFLVYQTRMTWTAATVALARPDLRDEYLGYARHGLAFLRDGMWDREHGGFLSSVLLDGRPDPDDPVKIVYGQAFAIYSLAAAHRATGDASALELAERAFRWVEARYRDEGRPGYRGGVNADGTRLPFDPESVRPANDAMGTSSGYRDMNAHIHLLEAYAALLREWPDAQLRARTQALFELVRDRFYAEPGCLNLYLDPDGRPVPGPVSFGHDVETGFLLIEAADALGVPEDLRAHRAARRLVDHALAWGWNAETGQLYEMGAGLFPAYDRSIQWWALYEMVNVLSLMDALHGQETPRYREALRKTWRYTRDTLTDTQYGGVYGGVDAQGRVDPAKSHDWNATYHTARALLLTADRLRRPPPQTTSRPPPAR